MVRTMVPPRSRSRHAKRLFVTLTSTFVAAGAMAYSTGGEQPHHRGDAHNHAQVASNGGTYGAGGVVLESQQNGSGGGAGGSGVGSGLGIGGGPRGVYGPGDGQDGSSSSNFMPNGEDGLTSLASYAAGLSGGQNGNSNSDHTPGGPQDGAPNGGSNPFTGSSAGGDGSSKVAGQDGGSGSGGGGGGAGSGGSGGFGGSSGFGAPSGGGGGFLGNPGGGGGGGGLLGNPSGGSTGSGGSNSSDPTGGGTTPPAVGDVPPVVTPPSGGGDCVVTETNSCQPGSAPSGPGGFAPSVPGGPAGGAEGAIPEPAAWMTMILGFGALGMVLRSRRRRAGVSLS
jgi:hypothetical protein